MEVCSKSLRISNTTIDDWPYNCTAVLRYVLRMLVNLLLIVAYDIRIGYLG